MENVKQNVAHGISTSQAVRGALLSRGHTMRSLADAYGIPRAGFTQAVNGAIRPTDEMIAALIKELGGTAREWRELLWLAGKPEHLGKVRIAG